MADTVQDLLDEIAAADVFDATSMQLLKVLNRRWRTMVCEARALRKTVAVATTTTASFYPFSPVEAYSFELAGVPYGKARRPDKYADSQGALWVTPDEAGLILEDADSTGAKGITLIPAPSAGLALTSFAAVKPDDLTNDPAGNALLLSILEDEFSEELVAGTLAAGLALREANPAAAAPYEQAFAAGVERLRRKVKNRFRGQTPHQIRVVGVNA